MILSLHLKLSKERLGSRILSGKLFQIAAAECLKPREPITNAVLFSTKKCLSDERRIPEEVYSQLTVHEDRQVD